MIAAISMALHEAQGADHDVEETILTISRVKRSYSPWSSKIYTLRETLIRNNLLNEQITMKEYKYKINGNLYKVVVGDIEDNNVHVEVNGTAYTVELEKQNKPKIKPVVRTAATTPAAPPAATITRPAPCRRQVGSQVSASWRNP